MFLLSASCQRPTFAEYLNQKYSNITIMPEGEKINVLLFGIGA